MWSVRRTTCFSRAARCARRKFRAALATTSDEDHRCAILGKKAATVTLTTKQRAVLEPLGRARTSPQRLVERSRIVLMAAEGRNNEDLAEELGVDRQRVRRWRTRWAKASPGLAAAEADGVEDKDLEGLILAIFSDEERSGAPASSPPNRSRRSSPWPASLLRTAVCRSRTGRRPR